MEFIDDCLFEIKATGKQLTRMEALLIWALLIAAILGAIGIASFR
ncbi:MULTISPECIES: hypothetical protein [unclassified Bosea (in: a-proteobacteria)]|nr:MULTISPECIES: hypothetical protein [unclassified Bosea (in: a-proteobacteria)]